jgi:hypothetical protein
VSGLGNLEGPADMPAETPLSQRWRVTKRRAIPSPLPSPISLSTLQSKHGYSRNSRERIRPLTFP